MVHGRKTLYLGRARLPALPASRSAGHSGTGTERRRTIRSASLSTKRWARSISPGLHLAASKKFRNLRSNPNVAFVVDDIASHRPVAGSWRRDPWHRRGARRRRRGERAPTGDPDLATADHQLERRKRRTWVCAVVTYPVPGGRHDVGPRCPRPRVRSRLRARASRHRSGSSTTARWPAKRCRRSGSTR